MGLAPMAEMTDRPFSPETLAERWGCSARHVRNLIKRGDINAFQLGGKLWRISAAEVARIEASGNTETQ
jgi:excisionase family DNA binding protein